MTEKFNQWKEHLGRVYGKDAFVPVKRLRADWERVSCAPVRETVEAIRAELGECSRCKLCGGRKTIVFGEGNSRARLMFVGEGPGEQEDIQGRPFVGRAGQLLDRIIEAMGLRRSDVYIANVVKCRPPGNRRPEPDEMAACEPFLFRQIDSLNPEILVALGATALECLLKVEPRASRGSDVRITKARGTFLEFRGRKLLPTYHPAYLLRNPPAKKDVWEDMKKVMVALGMPVPMERKE